MQEFTNVPSGIHIIHADHLSILESPVYEAGFFYFVEPKVKKLELLFSCLEDINTHVAY